MAAHISWRLRGCWSTAARSLKRQWGIWPLAIFSFRAWSSKDSPKMLNRHVSGLGSSQGSWSGAWGSVLVSFTVGCGDADDEGCAERSSSCQGVSGGMRPWKILSWLSYHSRWARRIGLGSSGVGVVDGSAWLGVGVGSSGAATWVGSSADSATRLSSGTEGSAKREGLPGQSVALPWKP